MSRSKGPFGLAARLVIAAGLTGYLLWTSDPRAVGAAVAGAAWLPITGAILLVLVDRALMAYRWVVLLFSLEGGSRPSLGAVLRIFFVSTFVGTFLPASVGGDAVRAYSLAKLNVPGADAVASVFMDRMLGVASVLVMALFGLTLAGDLAVNRTIVAALVVTAAACGATLLLIFSRTAALAASGLISQTPGAVQRAGRQILESIRSYAPHHRPLMLVLLCSLAVQALRILQAYLLGSALGIEAPLGAYFAFIPLILLVMLLPVTINGIGTSQAAFVWFFARAGVAAAPAFALSVLFVALGIIGNLPGAFLYAFGGGDNRPHAHPPSPPGGFGGTGQVKV